MYDKENSPLAKLLGGCYSKLVLLAFDANAHRSGSACDDAHGHLFVLGVEVGHLQFGDFAKLRLSQNASLVGLGVGGAFGDFSGSLDQVGCQRLLDDERVGSVAVDGDFHGEYEAHLRSSHFVVLLEELHHVDASLAESRTDRRSRGAFAGGDVELDY